MFSFNDGAVHESVELVVDGFGKYPMRRVDRSTVYCVDSLVIQKITRIDPRRYFYLYDGDKQTPEQQYSPPPERVARKEFNHPNGESTSYLCAAPPKKFSTLIYLIPGNPGLCEFYYDFVEAISAKIPDALVVAVSYRGFNVYNHSAGLRNIKLFTLEQQITHQAEFLDYILALYPSVQHVALLGHSVGSFISQRVAVRRPAVQFVGLLTPTVHSIALSEKGKTFVKAQSIFLRPIVAYLLVTVLLFVIPWSHTVVNLVVGCLQSRSRAETRSCSVALATSAPVVYQVVGLAREEMATIGHEIEPLEIAGFWDRQSPVYAMFALNDHWVSENSRDVLLEHARRRPNITTEILNVAHAFCMTDSEVAAECVTLQIKRWLKRLE